jgi:hypothetical protein
MTEIFIDYNHFNCHYIPNNKSNKFESIRDRINYK